MIELTPEQNHKLWLPQTFMIGWLFCTALLIMLPLYILIVAHLIPTQPFIWYYEGLVIPLLLVTFLIFIIKYCGGIIFVIGDIYILWKSMGTSQEFKSLMPNLSVSNQLLWMSLFSIIQMAFIAPIITGLSSRIGKQPQFLDHILTSILPMSVPLMLILYLIGLVIMTIIISQKASTLERNQEKP